MVPAIITYHLYCNFSMHASLKVMQISQILLIWAGASHFPNKEVLRYTATNDRQVY